MGQPYIGQITMVGFNFAPAGWAKCDGTVLPVSQNPQLFSLISDKYGGNGTSTFALPDLRGRVPIHRGDIGGFTYIIGQSGGAEDVTLQVQQLPEHTHGVKAGNEQSHMHGHPEKDYVLTIADTNFYSNPTTLVAMNSEAISSTGGSQPHDNMQPIQVINFIIALEGLYPPRP